MSDEVTEVAKAAQEIAKTTNTAIDATSNLGKYAARLFNESSECIVGILSDRLKFIRWERQLRLYDRWREIASERGVAIEPGILTPKLAIPMIESASLEENDELQDIWARLLVSAMDPAHKHKVRAAFIQIIRELEALDALTLSSIYDLYYNVITNDRHRLPTTSTSFGIKKIDILFIQPKSTEKYEEIMDNLFRMRLCAPYIENTDMMIVENGEFSQRNSSNVREYEEVSLTALGISFVETCIIQEVQSGPPE